ncbi:helix-turn-helix domain-containing protein [Fibrella aquatica]|jgi:transcriptional regulator GlxA family with amidase domain|uniref:helix-turn-helix domain-containing protein n=1 Tax=Fibrella aquatica TaxID=3242487 RepID=UPI00352076A2
MSFYPTLPNCPVGLLVVDYQKIIEVHNSIMQDLSIPTPTSKELAKKANMSTSKFRNTFIKIFGTSVHQYYSHVRIEFAKELLKDNKYNIEQIAYKVAFMRSQSFAKAFFNHTGQTASHYKTATLYSDKRERQ